MSGTIVKRSNSVSNKKTRIKEILESIDNTNFVTDEEKTAIASISALTASASELNTLDGYTGNTNDLNILSGAAAAGLTAAELLYGKNVTSDIQTQIDAKAAALTADQNYVSDAQLTVIQNTSGINTGDQTLSGLGVQRIYKSADETVNNSAVLQNDNHLILPVLANEVWEFKMTIFTSASGPFTKIGWTVPSGATLQWSYIGTTDIFDASGTAELEPGIALVIVHVFVGGTAGNITLQWAQSSADPSDNKILKGSNIIAHKLA